MSYQTNQAASLVYRRAATQHASVVGLVIALHDTLIGNLQRAAKAIEREDIPTRCDELIHGFKVLTQLDAMLDMNNGGKTAVKIRRFYTHLRGQMLQAQFKLDPAILYAQVNAVLTVREAWEQLDSKGVQAEPPSRKTFQGAYPGAVAMPPSPDAELRTSFSCSG
jgi:flagellar biosynthetic protein FliS